MIVAQDSQARIYFYLSIRLGRVDKGNAWFIPPCDGRRICMTSRAPFLKTAYSGYYHRDLPEEDTELTHVGPGTPGGEYMDGSGNQ